jgi:hypothetical protein
LTLHISLPVEIKHIIFSLCFAGDYPIVDPVACCSNFETKDPLTLGVTLLRTCRRIYVEVDRRPLFAQNVFCFTTACKAKVFLDSLESHHAASIRTLEIDVRKLQSDRPDIAPDWVHYLGSEPGQLSSLRTDAPGLTSLRLNFESWPKIGLRRTELWKLLLRMLSKVEGLQRVVIVGASKGAAMSRRKPWSPVHYV